MLTILSLVLDGDQNSRNQCLYFFDKFSECAKPGCYVDKTETIWIGSKSMKKDCYKKSWLEPFLEVKTIRYMVWAC